MNFISKMLEWQTIYYKLPNPIQAYNLLSYVDRNLKSISSVLNIMNF